MKFLCLGKRFFKNNIHIFFWIMHIFKLFINIYNYFMNSVYRLSVSLKKYLCRNIVFDQGFRYKNNWKFLTSHNEMFIKIYTWTSQIWQYSYICIYLLIAEKNLLLELLKFFFVYLFNFIFCGKTAVDYLFPQKCFLGIYCHLILFNC